MKGREYEIIKKIHWSMPLVPRTELLKHLQFLNKNTRRIFCSLEGILGGHLDASWMGVGQQKDQAWNFQAHSLLPQKG